MRIVLRYARRGGDNVPNADHCIAAGGHGGAPRHLRLVGCGPVLGGVALRGRVGWTHLRICGRFCRFW